MADLDGLRIALIGGDARDQIVVQRLAALGAQVHIFGLPVVASYRIWVEGDVRSAILGAHALILPMSGVDSEGHVHAPLFSGRVRLTETDLAGLSTGTPVFVGFARPNLRQMVENQQLHLVEVADLDEVAILNSVPSAEGALQIAMQGSPLTLHASHVAIIGFGRVSMTLTRMLLGIGAKVQVFARSASQRARAWEMGAQALPLSAMAQELQDVDFIFNTVPAMILDSALLSKVRRQVMIIDLASSPGGTDFAAAEQLGIQAVLAPGLPGKVAPRTAGELLARVYPDLLLAHTVPQNKAASRGGA
ncbi:dipicolinate synthase subunit DpsA [Heliophilum fasciatum]|uniref:Dipicolinate synthase subunit A n=1 Tax=Heliophilum fasciatum TaxID=35700 RepID=A0A4R2RQ75_9FIRM|nr:dipicolinate synthase subunit DpsA [Heliophilum fasciatum]MCW2277883.1 dipicolinate synthase subunit A [Heliophilum fasciatum]TCP64547.1 dipicolinate synthase subunit A [Heliophilum fasciatum]